MAVPCALRRARCRAGGRWTAEGGTGGWHAHWGGDLHSGVALVGMGAQWYGTVARSSNRALAQGL